MAELGPRSWLTDSSHLNVTLTLTLTLHTWSKMSWRQRSGKWQPQFLHIEPLEKIHCFLRSSHFVEPGGRQHCATEHLIRVLLNPYFYISNFVVWCSSHVGEWTIPLHLASDCVMSEKRHRSKLAKKWELYSMQKSNDSNTKRWLFMLSSAVIIFRRI